MFGDYLIIYLYFVIYILFLGRAYNDNLINKTYLKLANYICRVIYGGPIFMASCVAPTDMIERNIISLIRQDATFITFVMCVCEWLTLIFCF